MKNGWKLAQDVSGDVVLCGEYLDAYLQPMEAPVPVEQILRLVADNEGKKMRPALLLLAARFGVTYEARRKQLCTVAALVEMIHAASLIHDDIVDDSPMRRGSPTVQSKFGKDMAVYAGDLLLSRMMEKMLEAGLFESGKILTASITRMCYGELCQKDAMFSPDATLENYFTVIQGKTAALFEAACRCGALEGGCDSVIMEHLAEFGNVFGMLFQLRDDLLDFDSDAQKLGKPVHQDFLHGVFTMPVLHALHTPSTSAEMREAVSLLKTCPDQACELMNSAVRRCGGIAFTQAYMSKCHGQAKAVLELLPDCTSKAALTQALSIVMSS